jgi:galactoside O-acetyltransferase
MSFLSKSKLNEMGFAHVGKNVLISEKCSIYNPEQISIGDNSRIDDFCVISGKVSIGRNVHIAVFCNVAGGEAGISMDDFSGLAYNVQLFAQSDDYSGNSLTNPTVPDEYKSETKAPIYIGKHVIIGTSSVVFPGVEIAEGCSVGSLSLVSKSTEPWKIYIGIPARPVGDRSRRMLELERKYIQE